MKPIALMVCISVTAMAADSVPWRQMNFEGDAGWSRWAARDEIAPRAFVDRVVGRGEPGALAISGNSNAAAYGGWRKQLVGVTPGKWYRLTAHYRAMAVPHEQLQVLARLDWLNGEGKRAGQPDYAYRVEPAGGEWKRVVLDAPAPEGSVALNIELYLQNAPLGSLWWDDLSLEAIDQPGPRKVTVAAVNLRPRSTGSAEASVAKFVELVQDKVGPGTDVILLPEGVTVVGTGKKYAEVAEAVPGPTTAKLGELARAKKAYVVAGIYEREGIALYNTAVLIDRAGQVIGKYRKVYLPREEIEAATYTRIRLSDVCDRLWPRGRHDLLGPAVRRPGPRLGAPGRRTATGADLGWQRNAGQSPRDREPRVHRDVRLRLPDLRDGPRR